MKDSAFTKSSLRRILPSQSGVCEGFCLHTVKFVKDPAFTKQVCEEFCLHKVKLTSTFVLRGRRGTNSHLRHFAWQVWHKLTSTIVLRGRRGTDGTGWRAWSDLVARDAAALCVAGVAQTHIYRSLRGRRGTKLT